jgi:hypothetical protein
VAVEARLRQRLDRLVILLTPGQAGRGGTPDEVGTVGALLMGPDGAFITGSDVLRDGGVTAPAGSVNSLRRRQIDLVSGVDRDRQAERPQRSEDTRCRRARSCDRPALARLQLLLHHDPQFRRNRERVARDAERERLIVEWDLGVRGARDRPTRSGRLRSRRRCLRRLPMLCLFRASPARSARARCAPSPSLDSVG